MTNPPINHEAERIVLASTFLRNDVVGDCIAAGITEDCFTNQLHKDVWNAVNHQFLNGKEFDELSISMELNNRYLPDDVNLLQDINALTAATETTISTPIYISECVDTRNKRKAHHVALETLDALERGDTYQEIHKSITNTLSETDTGVAQDVSIPEVAQKVIDDTIERNSKRIKHIGLSTGFGLVDHILGGLRPESQNIIAGRPGAGKCLGRGTKVVMSNGLLKNVEDVQTGEYLMGPNNSRKKVLSTTKGYGRLYKVKQNKAIDYVVNSDHILSLRASGTQGKRKHGDIINIPIEEYLKKSKKFQTRHKGWKTGWGDIDSMQHSVDPYFLGLWLGDGTTACVNITNSDPEIIEWCKQYAEDIGHKCHIAPDNNTYRIAITRHTKKGGSQADSLQKRLSSLGVIGDKHIPEEYLKAGKTSRRFLLAGLLDTDGYLGKRNGYEITQKSEKLARQIKFIADSLGLRTSINSKQATIKSIGYECTVWKVHIYGTQLSYLPIKVKRKQLPYEFRLRERQDYINTGIKIEPIGQGEYFGFELSGDHLFLLEDGTVTHNTTLALQIALNNLEQGIPVRIHSLEMSPEQLIAKMVANRSGVDMNRARDGMLMEADFQKMEQARAWLMDKPLFIAHTHTTTVDKIATQHRRDIAKYGNTLCIIDYLQLIKSLNRQASREQQVAEMSRDLKCLWKDTGTQGITLSQLNRNSDETAEPKLSDLRESGSIEQDTDTAMFIYKHTDLSKRNVKIAKNRHGSEGKAELTFNGATSKLQ